MGGVHLIRYMASNAGNRNPDPISLEGGGPAHNTTLDVLDGRLPGADQTSDEGQTLREPSGDQLTGTDSRNRETHRDACGPWVIKVLEWALAVRHLLDDQQTTLTTMDKAIAESLWALGFNDVDAARACLLLPYPMVPASSKLATAPTTQHTHPDVRHLVGVWLSQARYRMRRLSDRNSWQLPLHQTPTLQHQPSISTSLGAGGADLRAGFCGSASTGASHGASPAVRASSQPLGAEFCAQLSAFAVGSSTTHNNNNP